jgi:hypothetical protein
LLSDGTARTQTIDFGRVKSELREDLAVVFPNVRARFADTLATPCT